MLSLYRPHVVHLSLPWPRSAAELRAACAIWGAPTVIVHQLVPDAQELGIDPRLRRLYALARFRRQNWVCVSQFGRQVLAEAFGVPEHEMRVIYNGPRKISAEPERSAALRHLLGISPEEKVILSVGRLHRVKGHDVLVEAVGKLRQSRDDIRVLIVGEGEDRPALEAQIARMDLRGRVRLIGQAHDVDPLLRSADLFVFPSRLEGAPFAMLEAMSIGLPVIATRFGGADEFIEHGVSGLLVPCDDPDALAATIELALGNAPATAAIGAKGREVAGRYSRSVMLSETLSLLHAEAARTSPRRPLSRPA
jgi:glycosyltransferase involved in cell wall biosynthesis